MFRDTPDKNTCQQLFNDNNALRNNVGFCAILFRRKSVAKFDDRASKKFRTLGMKPHLIFCRLFKDDCGLIRLDRSVANRTPGFFALQRGDLIIFDKDFSIFHAESLIICPLKQI